MLVMLAIGILLLISVFTVYTPFYMQSAEASFSSTRNLSNTTGFSSDPQIAVFGSKVYVVWQDFTPGNWDIFFRTSNDNGATFGNTINLSNNAGESGRPQIAVSDNNVYVVWVNYIPENYDVLFRTSNDNGATFGNAVKLDTSPGLADLPRVAVSSNNVYVIWEDYSEAEGLDIFFRASNDKGATFSSAVNLIRNVGYSLSTPLVVSGSNVYIISSIGNIDIYFRASRDNGTMFDNAIKLNSDTGTSSDPQIVVSGNNGYVVWQGYAPGNSDIFFRTFIHSNNAEAVEKMAPPADNGSIKVEVTMDRGTLETGQPIRFTFKFLHPVTGEQLQDVNYSFMIMDEKGNNVVNRPNIHTHEGIDTQSVTFSNTGLFTVAVDVAGLGIDKPYDSRYNGIASVTVTVVPEFPLSILVVMAVVIGTVIAITHRKQFLIDAVERSVEA